MEVLDILDLRSFLYFEVLLPEELKKEVVLCLGNTGHKGLCSFLLLVVHVLFEALSIWVRLEFINHTILYEVSHIKLNMLWC